MLVQYCHIPPLYSPGGRRDIRRQVDMCQCVIGTPEWREYSQIPHVNFMVYLTPQLWPLADNCCCCCCDHFRIIVCCCCCCCCCYYYYYHYHYYHHHHHHHYYYYYYFCHCYYYYYYHYHYHCRHYYYYIIIVIIIIIIIIIIQNCMLSSRWSSNNQINGDSMVFVTRPKVNMKKVTKIIQYILILCPTTSITIYRCKICVFVMIVTCYRMIDWYRHITFHKMRFCDFMGGRNLSGTNVLWDECPCYDEITENRGTYQASIFSCVYLFTGSYCIH